MTITKYTKKTTTLPQPPPGPTTLPASELMYLTPKGIFVKLPKQRELATKAATDYRNHAATLRKRTTQLSLKATTEALPKLLEKLADRHEKFALMFKDMQDKNYDLHHIEKCTWYYDFDDVSQII